MSGCMAELKGRSPTLTQGGFRGKLAGDNCAKPGRKAAARLMMAATTSGDGVQSQPENSRELPSSILPVAEMVAVKVMAGAALLTKSPVAAAS